MVTDLQDLPDIDASWVKTYSVERHGRSETFSVLENAPTSPRGTIVCVHGNPTWSFMWRKFVAELGDTWRVIALDQLGMGFSSRPHGVRTLATRIDDLDALLRVAGVDGPVVLMAHDWGGPVALGWATQHRQRVEKLVLFNTGTHIPTTGVPGLIQVSNTKVLRDVICSRTTAFIHGAVRTTGGIPREVRKGYLVPYRSARRRRAIADFVADIPVSHDHVTEPVLAELARRARELHVPTLLMWGVRDFVFHTGVLGDVQQTFPHADTITLDTGHLSPEHSDAPHLVREWLSMSGDISRNSEDGKAPDIHSAYRRRARETPQDTAIFDARSKLRTSWSEFEELVQKSRAYLLQEGAVSGDRVAILAPFSARTIACIYACWAEGLVPVVADPGLGISNMRRALRESRPRFVFTSGATRVAARVLHLAYRAQRLSAKHVITVGSPDTQNDVDIADVQEAAVLYTSGATGPAKGVVYTHGQLRALAHSIQQQFEITDADAIAAAYVPFALYGPAWGTAVALPKINVVAPAKLTASDLRFALDAVQATLVFAAPAPLRNVIKDGTLFPTVRCVMSAGAPVSSRLLEDVAKSFPMATLCSPYGMTEMLIVTDGVRGHTQPMRGVPVGKPTDTAEVVIFPLGFQTHDAPQPVPLGVTGEVFVSGPWLSAGYDQHWLRTREARVMFENRQWHRTGDVGHWDNGLFIEGRVAHMIHTASGVVSPVPIEQAVESLFPHVSAAAVGVKKNSFDHIVVVLCDGSTSGKAADDVRSRVQEVCPNVSEVLWKKTLPVDRRHNSKIDRIQLREWATKQVRGQ